MQFSDPIIEKVHLMTEIPEHLLARSRAAKAKSQTRSSSQQDALAPETEVAHREPPRPQKGTAITPDSVHGAEAENSVSGYQPVHLFPKLLKNLTKEAIASMCLGALIGLILWLICDFIIAVTHIGIKDYIRWSIMALWVTVIPVSIFANIVFNHTVNKLARRASVSGEVIARMLKGMKNSELKKLTSLSDDELRRQVSRFMDSQRITDAIVNIIKRASR